MITVLSPRSAVLNITESGDWVLQWATDIPGQFSYRIDYRLKGATAWNMSSTVSSTNSTVQTPASFLQAYDDYGPFAEIEYRIYTVAQTNDINETDEGFVNEIAHYQEYSEIFELVITPELRSYLLKVNQGEEVIGTYSIYNPTNISSAIKIKLPDNNEGAITLVDGAHPLASKVKVQASTNTTKTLAKTSGDFPATYADTAATYAQVARYATQRYSYSERDSYYYVAYIGNQYGTYPIGYRLSYETYYYYRYYYAGTFYYAIVGYFNNGNSYLVGYGSGYSPELWENEKSPKYITTAGENTYTYNYTYYKNFDPNAQFGYYNKYQTLTYYKPSDTYITTTTHNYGTYYYYYWQSGGTSYPGFYDQPLYTTTNVITGYKTTSGTYSYYLRYRTGTYGTNYASYIKGYQTGHLAGTNYYYTIPSYAYKITGYYANHAYTWTGTYTYSQPTYTTQSTLTGYSRYNYTYYVNNSGYVDAYGYYYIDSTTTSQPEYYYQKTEDVAVGDVFYYYYG